MKVAFYTLGCKANQFETQALERLFTEKGHDVVPFESYADVYVVNTCTVTAMSDRKSRAAARRCKKQNPNARLILCGCYAQVKDQEAKEAYKAFALEFGKREQAIERYYDHYVANYALRKIVNNTY